MQENNVIDAEIVEPVSETPVVDVPAEIESTAPVHVKNNIKTMLFLLQLIAER
jgi:hypothetical protein